MNMKEYLQSIHKLNERLKGIQTGKISRNVHVNDHAICIALDGTKNAEIIMDTFPPIQIDEHTKTVGSLFTELYRKNKSDLLNLLEGITLSVDESIEIMSRIYSDILADQMSQFVESRLSGEEIPATAAERLVYVATKEAEKITTRMNCRLRDLPLAAEVDLGMFFIAANSGRKRSTAVSLVGKNISSSFRFLANKDKFADAMDDVFLVLKSLSETSSRLINL